jgi:hypothetical protein
MTPRSDDTLTALNIIAGMADMLLETELSSEQRAYATTIRQSAAALLVLARELGDASSPILSSAACCERG